MAGTANLYVDQGADFQELFTYQDSAGNPIEVTGWTALMQLRTSPGSELLIELTDSSGITVGTTDGTFLATLTAVQTLTLEQNCKYDLLVTDTTGKKIRLAEGTVAVDLSISEPA